MKRILPIALALFSAASFGATLNPIQLLSPAGSSSGQAVVSTGPSSAPAWTTITPAGIGGLNAANNLSDVASATASLANLGGLSTTAAASTYLTQANAASTYATISNLALKAPLASPTFTGTVTIPAGASITTPVINQPTVVGVTTATVASAGSIGEYKSSSVSASSPVSLNNGTPLNITSISLTPGIWQVWGSVGFSAGGVTTTNQQIGWISAVSAALPGAPNNGAMFSIQGQSAAGAGSAVFPVGMEVVALSSTTTIYLSAQSSFSASTSSAYGFVGAVRIH